jgi:hypothetical protein
MPSLANKANLAEVLAICIKRESCFHHTGTTTFTNDDNWHVCFHGHKSIALAIFSPTTLPIEPPMKPKSIQATNNFAAI